MRKNHQDDVREKIQASQLINRLMDHFEGKVELSPTQLRAGEILLRKRLPDLSNVEIANEEGETFKIEKLVREIVRTPNSDG